MIGLTFLVITAPFLKLHSLIVVAAIILLSIIV